MEIIHQQYIIIAVIMAIYSILSSFVAYKLKNNASERKRLLWKLIIGDVVFFIICLLTLALTLPHPILIIISWIGYSLILPYVVVIEIPGYLLISKFDERNLEILKEIRKNLVKMRYSFNNGFDALKSHVEKNKNHLSKENIGALLDDFIECSNRMTNLNPPFWELALNELTSSINGVSNKSKHPFPKLIDVLSLAGLSFLIAQLLEMVL